MRGPDQHERARTRRGSVRPHGADATTRPCRRRTSGVPCNTGPTPPSILNPPASVAAELERLRLELDARIPPKRVDQNVLVATWNLRAFGGLTDRWLPRRDDAPKRNLRDIRCIAAVVERFDVVALQECRGDIKALRNLMKALGPAWALMLTDVTKGPQGNDERMAFVFDTRRLKPSGLACELVVPVAADRRRIKRDAFDRQFARTPYAVSFLARDTTFVLVTLHVYYKKGDVGERIAELKAIAEWMRDWARRVNEWEHNLIALGDFNIDRHGDPLYDAFTSTGLASPAALDAVPRTIFGEAGEHFYDQIAWFHTGTGDAVLSLECLGSGSFDFVPGLGHGMTRAELSWHLSDHYPLWVEFGLAGGPRLTGGRRRATATTLRRLTGSVATLSP